jgi:hypothetical protein
MATHPSNSQRPDQSHPKKGATTRLQLLAFVLLVIGLLDIFLVSFQVLRSESSGVDPLEEKRLTCVKELIHRGIPLEHRLPDGVSVSYSDPSCASNSSGHARSMKYEHINNQNIKNIPLLIASLMERFPSMTARRLPPKRWEAVANTTCLKDDDDEESVLTWETRVPFAILIGVQKGGTTALASYLSQHPQIVASKKEFHFLSQTMDMLQPRGGIDQTRWRQHYARHIDREKLKVPLETVQDNPNLYVLDATPKYIMYSDRVPQRVLCLFPWVKLMALLRNPIDRAFSQYSMDMSGNKSIVPFDEWVRHDYAALLATGVLRNHSSSTQDFERFSGSHEEMEAWKVYTKLGTSAAIGRGLYSLQLRHWFQAFAEQGKTLNLLAIQSEAMEADSNAAYARVLNFLELPQLSPESSRRVHKFRTNYAKNDSMSNETRRFLESIFAPYNRQLASLLGEGWEGVWSSADY